LLYNENHGHSPWFSLYNNEAQHANQYDWRAVLLGQVEVAFGFYMFCDRRIKINPRQLGEKITRLGCSEPQSGSGHRGYR